MKKIVKYSLLFILAIVCSAGIFFAGVYFGVFGHLYTKEELRDFKNESASLVLAENGELLGKYFVQNRTNVKFHQIPTHLINALLATEDVRFYEHEGVDARSLMRVLVKSIIFQQESAGGGSTLTQQLAKNMYGRKSFGPLTTAVNKSKEIILANRLEELYNKQDILQLYLNTVPFGEDIYGVESAARRYFNKQVEELNQEESAVLVGMLKANTYYNPRLYPEHALQRRNTVLDQMFKYDFIDEREKDSLQLLPIRLDYANLKNQGKANYFLVHIKRELEKIIDSINLKEGTSYNIYTDGLIVQTSLNLEMQLYALTAYQKHLSKMQPLLDRQYSKGSDKKILTSLSEEILNKGNFQDVGKRKKREIFSWEGFRSDSITVLDSIRRDLSVLHAGMLGLEPNTGAIKVWVGGIDFRRYPYDQIFAQRQIASTFKPILYAAALENGINPCNYISNDSLVLTDFDNWTPKNYDNSFGGKYSVAAALAKSMNIPTVRLFLSLPFAELHTMWNDLGFSQHLETNPSVALGTSIASIYELTRAYAAFANGGKKIQPYGIVSIKSAEGETIYQYKDVKNDEQVMSESTSMMMTAMLRKAVSEGTGKAISSQFGVTKEIAGKTGTSQDYADAWFAGFTPNLVLVSRVGCNSPSLHFNTGALGSGGKLALPLVGYTFRNLQGNKKLSSQYLTNFAPMSEEALESFICEDYIEDSDFEKFFDKIFNNPEMTSEKAAKKAQKETKKKESFFKKLFKKRN
ncbi:transglycosylase domain-containing protein [Namhaeicola litoreus]|uniref:Transglycosylase domain-containing protein n=1 Tax=Namhaeicola litoreus TaxID=1052145 RepID=A0ABW3Y279_9FLAO